MSRIIVPCSGGKDSTACLIKAIDTVGKNNVVAVFNDTGWEHPLTYQYFNYLKDRLGITIHTTTGGVRKDGTKIQTLPELIKSHGKFPFGLGRFCTTYLKQYALRNWYADNLFDGITNYLIWFGMRSSESGQRARKYKGIEPDDVFDMEDLFPKRYNKKLRKTLSVSLPIVNWETKEVFDFLKEKEVNYNPLYDEGTNDRVGCYPCLLAGKKVQEKMFRTPFGQKRLAIIKELEREIGAKYEMYDTDQGSCEVCKI